MNLTISGRMIGCTAWLLALLCSLPACQSDSQESVAGPARSSTPDLDADPMLAVTYARQPMADRHRGVQRMLTRDAGRFWKDCAALTRQIDDWPMIRLLCAKAEETQDKRALPWLIRSWAMPSKVVMDQDRPEREALAAIMRQEVDAILSTIVFLPSEADAPATQVAAWAVLVRAIDHKTLRERIAATPDEGASLLVSILKQAVPALDRLPADRLAIACLMRLVAAYPGQHWLAWADWREASDSNGPATLALRHLPAIEHRDPARDTWVRDRWVKHIESRLAGRRHAARGSDADDDLVVRQHPGRFADHADRLGLADLLVLDAILDAMDEPDVRRVAFEQAEADRRDTSTELGGVLGWDDQGRPTLRPFAPLIHRHDQAYIASTSCINALYLGLAHFHFHTQRYDNAVWAGPGQGDRAFADRYHVTAIVMTFLDQHTLNVDAFMPGGISIDLGCMTR